MSPTFCQPPQGLSRLMRHTESGARLALGLMLHLHHLHHVHASMSSSKYSVKISSFSFLEVSPTFCQPPQGLSRLMRHTESDAWLALGLMHHLSVLPLYKALSCLSGSLWAKALQVCELAWGSLRLRCLPHCLSSRGHC